MNGRQRNTTNAQIWGKKNDSNYDGNCTARHCLSGTYEISRRWIFFGLLNFPDLYEGEALKGLYCHKRRSTHIFKMPFYLTWAGIAQSVSRRSGVRIPVGTKFSAPVQTGPGAHPASYTMGTGSFPAVKRPGLRFDHPPPSSAQVKGRVALYLYSPFGPSCPVLGRTLPLRSPTHSCI